MLISRTPSVGLSFVLTVSVREELRERIGHLEAELVIELAAEVLVVLLEGQDAVGQHGVLRDVGHQLLADLVREEEVHESVLVVLLVDEVAEQQPNGLRSRREHVDHVLLGVVLPLALDLLDGPDVWAE